MLPEQDRLDDIFADDASGENAVVDIAEFKTYTPVICCAIIMAFILTVITQAVLSTIGASSWIGRVLMLLYATLPMGAMMIWAWDKPAIRIADGHVLRKGQVRAYIGMIWAVSIGLLALHLMA